MKRVLAAACLAVAVLAGCGNDTCTSSAAKLDTTLSSPSCTLAAGTSAVIRVPLCSRCNDSTPGCQAEFVGNRFEVAPTVQQCQEQSGCTPAATCNLAVRTANCGITIPAGLSGQYDLVVVGDGSLVQGTINIGSGSSCSL